MINTNVYVQDTINNTVHYCKTLNIKKVIVRIVRNRFNYSVMFLIEDDCSEYFLFTASHLIRGREIKKLLSRNRIISIVTKNLYVSHIQEKDVLRLKKEYNESNYKVNFQKFDL